jgi:hypothetical protein
VRFKYSNRHEQRGSGDKFSKRVAEEDSRWEVTSIRFRFIGLLNLLDEDRPADT